MYLLDTNVVSEFAKVSKGLADRNVAAWALAMPQHSRYLSVITILELEKGVLRMQRRDLKQARYLRRWLEQSVAEAFQGRIYDVSEAIARRCASLHVPDPKSEFDSLIAATALVHDLTIVTRNTRDFARTGARILNPWLPA